MHSISALFWTSGIYIHFKDVNFFATMVFIHYDEKIKTSLYRKPRYCQTYLHTKFETSKKKDTKRYQPNIKKSIPSSTTHKKNLP